MEWDRGSFERSLLTRPFLDSTSAIERDRGKEPMSATGGRGPSSSSKSPACLSLYKQADFELKRNASEGRPETLSTFTLLFPAPYSLLRRPPHSFQLSPPPSRCSSTNSVGFFVSRSRISMLGGSTLNSPFFREILTHTRPHTYVCPVPPPLCILHYHRGFSKTRVLYCRFRTQALAKQKKQVLFLQKLFDGFRASFLPSFVDPRRRYTCVAIPGRRYVRLIVFCNFSIVFYQGHSVRLSHLDSRLDYATITAKSCESHESVKFRWNFSTKFPLEQCNHQ